ncbi:MAG: OmpH family outer membrane protein [Melioribacteraceae bacterium]|nr:OmpH family outer membrane protein [Melioribacteraceae bacterium]MCF8354934.1 OmpH family outer membrane protein [Melioribacteraceae bacterium]MCF8392377.1 OmpH family outer membrane protein [Melioribacteraceae bacterium]MCF8417897.1 OmpH family outer membrane protein [Melioribacteraceae bacterium]
MKRVLLVSLIFIAGSLFAQTSQKIGYVNSEVIFAQFSEAIKAQSDLEAISANWAARRDSMVQDLQSSYEVVQKQATTMAPDKLNQARQELAMKEQQITQYQQQKFGQNGELYVKQEEIFAPVKEKIMNAISEVAKAEGMNFVFDKSGDILLLYADEAFDITFPVLDKLKRGKK